MLFQISANDSKLPCGCPVHGTKVYVAGKQVPDAVSVEARWAPRRVDLDGAFEWTVIAHAVHENGDPWIVDGEILYRHVVSRNVELRCRHHPEYGG